MQLKVLTKILLSLLFMIAPLFCIAQMNVSDAEILLRKADCVESLRPSRPEFLRIVRREDFEDRIFELRSEDGGLQSKLFFVFEVSSSGIFVTSENEVVRVDSTGIQSKLLAVSKQPGQLFQLYGCSAPKNQFIDLVRNAKITIKSTSNAESFLYLYYSLTSDPELSRVVYNLRNIKHGVENYFFSEFETSEAQTRFQNWMSKFENNGPKQKLGVVAVAVPDGYRVSLTYLELIRNSSPRVVQLELLVDEFGTIKSDTTQILFALKKR